MLSDTRMWCCCDMLLWGSFFGSTHCQLVSKVDLPKMKCIGELFQVAAFIESNSFVWWCRKTSPEQLRRAPVGKRPIVIAENSYTYMGFGQKSFCAWIALNECILPSAFEFEKVSCRISQEGANMRKTGLRFFFHIEKMGERTHESCQNGELAKYGHLRLPVKANMCEMIPKRHPRLWKWNIRRGCTLNDQIGDRKKCMEKTKNPYSSIFMRCFHCTT